MQEARRVDAYEARERVQSGEALLVCAYQKEAQFRAARLEGAISKAEFDADRAALSPKTELIFYCA